MQPIKMLVLALTGRCNFSCVYCYAEDYNCEQMSFEVAKQAINLAAKSGEEFVLQFSGGEPLLAFDLLREIALYVEFEKIPAIMQLQTNGSLLTEYRANFLRTHHIGIGISLDGRPKINDRMRLLKDGKGATKAILKGIQVLQEQEIAIGITCVVTNENVNELSGIVEMAYYLGNVKKIGFDLLRCQGRGTFLRQPEEKAVAFGVTKAYDAATQFAKLTGRTIQFAQIERAKILEKGRAACFGHCYAMNGEAAFVDATGKIYACASLMEKEEFYIGDVATGIDAVRYKAVSEQIKKSMQFCFKCEDFALCGGGCFARWYGSGCTGAYKGECALKRISIARR